MKSLLTASTIAIALTLSAASATAKNVVLKPINEDLATQACLVAATDSMSAAKDLVIANGISFNEFRQTVSCNGMSLRVFANEYGYQNQQDSEEVSVIATRVALVAKNTNVESQLCLDAVKMGEDEARSLHSIDAPVMCNGLDLPDFLLSFANQEVEIRNTAD